MPSFMNSQEPQKPVLPTYEEYIESIKTVPATKEDIFMLYKEIKRMHGDLIGLIDKFRATPLFQGRTPRPGSEAPWPPEFTDREPR